MRDLLVFGTVLLMLPVSFRRPFLGLLLFSWLAYMRPQDLCWGFARDMRFSFFAGLTMVVGWFVHERGRRPFTRWDVRTRLLVVLTGLVTVSYGCAGHHDDFTNRYFFEFLKIILVALFTAGQCDSRQRLRWMFWTIALCLGFYGVKNGVLSVMRGGQPILRGPGGMLEDNNDFALGLVMNVPLLWYLAADERHLRWLRLGLLVAIPCTAITVLLTHSRGGFLALVCTLLWIAWRSGHLFRAAFALASAAGAFFLLVPAHVLERIASISDTQESSVLARFTSWRAALRMIGDHPVLGVGLRNFQLSYLDYVDVRPERGGMTYVAHNSYLQIWAESGTIAFGVYLLLLVSVFWTCWRLHRLGRTRPDLAWASNYARMMEATTVGFMVGAFFLNRGHFDLVYHWLALVTALAGVVIAAWVRRSASAERAGARRGSVTVRWRSPVTTAPLGRWGRVR